MHLLAANSVKRGWCYRLNPSILRAFGNFKSDGRLVHHTYNFKSRNISYTCPGLSS